MGHSTPWKKAVFKMAKSKRGYIFVEASLVLPLLVSIVIVLLGYAYESCDTVKEQAENHNEKRNTSINEGILNDGESGFARKIDLLMEGIK